MAVSIRIYSSGNYVVNVVDPEHLQQHIEYNTTMRFGCALVVDGAILHEGYLDKCKIVGIVDSIDTSKLNKFLYITPYK